MKTQSALLALLLTLLPLSNAIPTHPRRQTFTLALPTVIFSLNNDITGANEPRTLTANGTPVPLGVLYKDSTLVKDGVVKATSGHVISIDDNVHCFFNDNGTIGTDFRAVGPGVLTVNMVRDPLADVQPDVSGFTVTCSIDEGPARA